MSHQPASPTIAVLVHGLFGGEGTWRPLLLKLGAHGDLEGLVTFRKFLFDSPIWRWGVSRRIPDLDDIADQLHLFLTGDREIKHAERLVLIGHSFGGLVIQAMLAKE